MSRYPSEVGDVTSVTSTDAVRLLLWPIGPAAAELAKRGYNTSGSRMRSSSGMNGRIIPADEAEQLRQGSERGHGTVSRCVVNLLETDPIHDHDPFHPFQPADRPFHGRPCPGSAAPARNMCMSWGSWGTRWSPTSSRWMPPHEQRHPGTDEGDGPGGAAAAVHERGPLPDAETAGTELASIRAKLATTGKTVEPSSKFR